MSERNARREGVRTAAESVTRGEHGGRGDGVGGADGEETRSSCGEESGVGSGVGGGGQIGSTVRESRCGSVATRSRSVVRSGEGTSAGTEGEVGVGGKVRLKINGKPGESGGRERVVGRRETERSEALDTSARTGDSRIATASMGRSSMVRTRGRRRKVGQSSPTRWCAMKAMTTPVRVAP